MVNEAARTIGAGATFAGLIVSFLMAVTFIAISEIVAYVIKQEQV